MKAVRIHETGDVNVLQVDNNVSIPEISSHQVLIKVIYSSVNFIDTYFRSGLYPVPSLPKVLGQDGSGLIEKIGDQVPAECGLKVGDRVAFCGSSGSYAEYTAVEYHNIVKLPSEISLKDSVACMVNGLTAYYLAFDIPSARSDVVLVHAASGGTSRLLVQILSKIKKCSTIIGTVGSPEKVDLALKLGCTHVIQYSTEDVVEKVKEITKGKGVDVVYDGVGKDTYQSSLNSLGVRGLFISYGNASGPVGLINPLDLSRRGSISFTRPKMGDFYLTFDELQEKSQKLLSFVSQGLVDINIHKTFSLDEIKEAHNEIEGRKTVGKILLKVNEEP